MSEEKDFIPGSSDAAVYAPLPGRPESPHSAGWDQTVIGTTPATIEALVSRAETAERELARAQKAGAISVDALRLKLRERIGPASSVKEWAEANGLTYQQVYYFLGGGRPPEPKLLRALRFKRVTLYIPDHDAAGIHTSLQNAQPTEAARERSEHSTAVTQLREDQ